MSYQERDNSGALFRNTRKEKETHPDYTGTCIINGKKLEMSAWVKTAKSGTKYMSFSFRPSERQDNYRDAGDDFGGWQ
jgi:hypothetical protein